MHCHPKVCTLSPRHTRHKWNASNATFSSKRLSEKTTIDRYAFELTEKRLFSTYDLSEYFFIRFWYTVKMMIMANEAHKQTDYIYLVFDRRFKEWEHILRYNRRYLYFLNHKAGSSFVFVLFFFSMMYQVEANLCTCVLKSSYRAIAFMYIKTM